VLGEAKMTTALLDRLAITVTCRDRQLALQMPRRRSYNLRSHRLRSCNLHEYGRDSGARHAAGLGSELTVINSG
jgi:hypothetical protein